MNKISPCIWLDKEAMEAAEFYIKTFKNGNIQRVSHYLENSPMPEGTVLSVSFTLHGMDFNIINGGPIFKPNPSISFFVNCSSEKEIDELWKEFTKEGFILMELTKYPFSEKFGWVQDKYGVSWQLNLNDDKKKITPFIMFVGDKNGKAEEAMKYYCNVFKNSEIQSFEKFSESDGELAGALKQGKFSLFGENFIAMDGGKGHPFTFTEGMSFYLNCKDQEEIDYYWDTLTSEGEESQCGWLKDKFGVSWQIVNENFEEMISLDNKERSQRVMDALFKMKKIDLKVLQDAYDGK